VRVVRYRSIYRLSCDIDLEVRAGPEGVSLPEGRGTMLRGEAHGGRARKKRVSRGGGEGREEGTQGLLRPGRFERAGRAGRPGKPQERCGDGAFSRKREAFWEPCMDSGGANRRGGEKPRGRTVPEVVVTCGTYGRPGLSCAEGAWNPTRGALALRMRVQLQSRTASRRRITRREECPSGSDPVATQE